ncbi:MAG: CsgG/HfaB family protein, partial [Acidobacteriota bacterium]
MLKKSFKTLTCLLVASQLIGCSSSGIKLQMEPPPPPDSELREISILGRSRAEVTLPRGSRIVIAGIAGTCDLELKNALAKRLVDNNEFQVLDRDNLDRVLIEADANWGGRFNSNTAVRLGELLGASVFIVGQVIYCGTPDGREFPPRSELYTWRPTGEKAQLFAVLQVLDLKTGKVIMSSANRGEYSPTTDPLIFDSEAGSKEGLSRFSEGVQRTFDAFGEIPLVGGLGRMANRLIF